MYVKHLLYIFFTSLLAVSVYLLSAKIAVSERRGNEGQTVMVRTNAHSIS